ncbi:hypothetical protein LCGC14_2396920 [marine sediment metagenome]|uniref:Uncharacterized protein n=1 Tax=marine sediment metagenome TaxID=412755 RepID=A0A0F9BWK3_9ZZZZ
MLGNSNLSYKMNLDDFKNSQLYLQAQLEFCYHELNVYNQLNVVASVVKQFEASYRENSKNQVTCLSCNALLVAKLQNVEGYISHLLAHILDKYIIVQEPINIFIMGTLGIFEIQAIVAKIHIGSLTNINFL